MNLPFHAQVINLCAALLLLLAFAMLTQRRILSLINLFAAQGGVLVLSTLVVGYATQNSHLYVSAAVTLALKVLLLPMHQFFSCKIKDLQSSILTVQVLCRFRFESSVLCAPKQALQGLKSYKMYAHRTQLATS